MAATRSATLDALIRNSGGGWRAAWLMVHMVASAAVHAAAAAPLIDALPLLLIHADLRAAEEHLEHAHPRLASQRGADMSVTTASSIALVDAVDLADAAMAVLRGLERSSRSTLEVIGLVRARALLHAARCALDGVSS